MSKPYASKDVVATLARLVAVLQEAHDSKNFYTQESVHGKKPIREFDEMVESAIKDGAALVEFLRGEPSGVR